VARTVFKTAEAGVTRLLGSIPRLSRQVAKLPSCQVAESWQERIYLDMQEFNEWLASRTLETSSEDVAMAS
jgi:hypothetical protein